MDLICIPIVMFLWDQYLGGSAVLLSAIIGSFNNFRENKYTNYEIAELAFHAERIVMGLSGGWQDQYATVFGGLQLY